MNGKSRARIIEREATLFFKVVSFAAKKEKSTVKVPGLILYIGLFAAELINKSLTVFNLRLPVIGGLSRRTYRGLFKDRLFDNSAIKQELGFKPKTTLYDSLDEIIHYGEN